MGLALCKWLNSGPTWSRVSSSSSSSSSSPFHPLAVSMVSRLAVLLDTPPAPAADPRSLWSPGHHSPNFCLIQGGVVAHRVPTQQSTDAVRAALGQGVGLHVWEVSWDPAERGSHAVVGVATQQCPLQTSGYRVLVGGDKESWGWELGSNQLWHGNMPQGLYPGSKEDGGGERPPVAVPGSILMVLDADAGTLGFVVDGCFLGVAMRGLPRGAPLFPAASSVWGRCHIGLRYVNGASREPPSLTSLCRLSVRQALGKDQGKHVDDLRLAPALRRLL
ncbi:SPRY domain-containing SOCS box protein 4 [Paramormyrops kingsleyae]|uniref:SPRY domain-containing SOCS box protein 4 n=1 Tax=Paramormyrops kingsleyae TaxID=1676925 RepID=UPI003B96DD85